MKKIGIVFILLLCYSSFQAQHQINGYLGGTLSKIQVYTKPNCGKDIYYDELANMPVLGSPYLSMEYQYAFKPFRFSTGLSIMALGTSNFFFTDTPLGDVYLNVPIVLGYNWELPKDWGIVLKSGLEVGVSIHDLVTVFARNLSFENGAMKRKFKGTLNAVLGIETNWKQFKFGAKVHIGLTDYETWGTCLVMKHSAITTYIGYTLWDSQRAKERKAKRLAEKNAKG